MSYNTLDEAIASGDYDGEIISIFNAVVDRFTKTGKQIPRRQKVIDDMACYAAPVPAAPTVPVASVPPPTAQQAKILYPGSRVRIKSDSGIRPKYLHGVGASVVKVNRTTASVKFDEIPKHGVRRFRVPIDCLEMEDGSAILG